MKLLAEITFMLKTGKMKGKSEESKGWNLPNNLYIEQIYSRMIVILKTCFHLFSATLRSSAKISTYCFYWQILPSCLE